MTPQPADEIANAPDSLSVRFSGMAYGGDAVGKVDASGLTLFAWPGIASEQARVAIIERRKNSANSLPALILGHAAAANGSILIMSGKCNSSTTYYAINCRASELLPTPIRY